MSTRGTSFIQHNSLADRSLRHLCDHSGLMRKVDLLAFVSTQTNPRHAAEVLKTLVVKGYIRAGLVQVTRQGRNAARRAALRNARATTTQEAHQ